MTTDTALKPISAPARAAGWAPLAIVLTGTFVFVLDFFIVNVAMPAMQHGLRAGPAAVEWIVAGYSLTTAATLIVGGRLGDRYGRRAVFAIGLGLFVLTSAACALAPSAGALVVARLVQGAAAGLLAPNVLSIIGVAYDGERRTRAISAYGMVMGLAAACGQLIGGLLMHLDVFGFGWRSIFWINVPIGVVALLLIRVVPESRADRAGRLDVPGMLLITAAVTAVVLPLVDGRQQHWPLWSWLCLAAALPLFVTFGAHQLRRARQGGDPLLDLHQLARRGPAAGLTIQLLFWCQQAASYLFLALYLQEGCGLTPLGAGGMFTALVLGYLVTSFRAPQLTERFGRRVVLIGGLLAAVADGVLWLAVGDGTSLAWLLPGLVLLGAGQGLCIVPLTSTVLSFATPASAGTVSGALTTVQQIGNAVGVGVIGIVFFAAVPAGYDAAFARTLLLMAALLVVVAALTRVMRGVQGGGAS